MNNESKETEKKKREMNVWKKNLKNKSQNKAKGNRKNLFLLLFFTLLISRECVQMYIILPVLSERGSVQFGLVSHRFKFYQQQVKINETLVVAVAAANCIRFQERP